MDGDETGRKKFGPDTQPMRCCTRATDCPVAARHGNAALWPLLVATAVHQQIIYNFIRKPQIFCRFYLTLAIFAQYRIKFAISLRFIRVACFYLRPLSITKSSWTNEENRRRVIPVVFNFILFYRFHYVLYSAW